jgi:hypothetical protein
VTLALVRAFRAPRRGPLVADVRDQGTPGVLLRLDLGLNRDVCGVCLSGVKSESPSASAGGWMPNVGPHRPEPTTGEYGERNPVLRVVSMSSSFSCAAPMTACRRKGNCGAPGVPGSFHEPYAKTWSICTEGTTFAN